MSRKNKKEYLLTNVDTDKDVEYLERMQKGCDACCENFCTRLASCLRSTWKIFWEFLCFLGRFFRDYVWDLLYTIFVRPVFAALWKIILRLPDAVGGIANPFLLIFDTLACCKPNGHAGWPMLSVFSRIAEGGFLCLSTRTIVPLFFSGFLSVYFCALTLDLLNCAGTCHSLETGKSVWPRFYPFYSLHDNTVDSGRLWNLHPAYIPLVCLACYWGATVGWLEGKMTSLKWLPEAYERTEEKIRINILRRQLKHDRTHVGSYSCWYQSLEVLGNYLEFLLSFPAAVLGILWDTQNCMTLVKLWCGNNIYVQRGRKRMRNCTSYCCHCSDFTVEQRKDDNYTILLERKVLEFNSVKIATKNYLRGRTDKRSYAVLELEQLQIEQYIKDVANQTVSEPVLPSKGVYPPAIADWQIVARNHPQVQQLWALHSCEGLPVASIATCYNHTLYAIRNDLPLPSVPSLSGNPPNLTERSKATRSGSNDYGSFCSCPPSGHSEDCKCQPMNKV